MLDNNHKIKQSLVVYCDSMIVQTNDKLSPAEDLQTYNVCQRTELPCLICLHGVYLARFWHGHCQSIFNQQLITMLSQSKPIEQAVNVKH